MTPTRQFGAVVCALALLFTACGDGGEQAPDEQVASLDSTADDGAAGSAGRADFQEAVLDVSACLRDQGFEVADPTFDADGNPVLSPDLAPDIDLSSAEFLDAFDACSSALQDALPNPLGDLDPELEARVRDGLAEYAACMRENGVEGFPDPRPTGQPFLLRDIIALGADGDADGAQETCQPLLQQLAEQG